MKAINLTIPDAFPRVCPWGATNGSSISGSSSWANNLMIK